MYIHVIYSIMYMCIYTFYIYIYKCIHILYIYMYTHIICMYMCIHMYIYIYTRKIVTTPWRPRLVLAGLVWDAQIFGGDQFPSKIEENRRVHGRCSEKVNLEGKKWIPLD